MVKFCFGHGGSRALKQTNVKFIIRFHILYKLRRKPHQYFGINLWQQMLAVLSRHWWKLWLDCGFCRCCCWERFCFFWCTNNEFIIITTLERFNYDLIFIVTLKRPHRALLLLTTRSTTAWAIIYSHFKSQRTNCIKFKNKHTDFVAKKKYPYYTFLKYMYVYYKITFFISLIEHC